MKFRNLGCGVCGEQCFHKGYPEIVFSTVDVNCVVICENCSIDYEMRDGEIRFRQDLIDEGCVPFEPWID